MHGFKINDNRLPCQFGLVNRNDFTGINYIALVDCLHNITFKKPNRVM